MSASATRPLPWLVHDSAEPPPMQFCSVPQAAQILGCDRKTVLGAIHRRQLPAAKIGHNWRIDLAALRRKMVRRSS